MTYFAFLTLNKTSCQRDQSHRQLMCHLLSDLGPRWEYSLHRDTKVQRQIGLHIVMRLAPAGN
jgi:hypothetical protein